MGQTKKRSRIAGLSLLTLLLWSQLLLAQDAKEIIRKMEDQMRGNQSYMEMKLTTVRPRYTREMTMKNWSKGEDYSLILITNPARDRGTAFLKRKKEIWNWVPNIERMIKMPPSMMSQSWMGTDFSNDDLVRESSTIDDFSHKMVRSEKVEDRDCFVIEMRPKPDAAVVYDKILVWVSKVDYLQLRVENYDEYGELVNTLVFSDIKPMGKRNIPTKVELIPADKPGHKTIMEYISADFDSPIDEGFFSVQNLRQVR